MKMTSLFSVIETNRFQSFKVYLKCRKPLKNAMLTELCWYENDRCLVLQVGVPTKSKKFFPVDLLHRLHNT